MSIERFNFMIAYELYELDGELESYYSPRHAVRYGTQHVADNMLKIAQENLPQYDWAIYKLEKT